MSGHLKFPGIISRTLTLSQLMLHICGVSKTFGEWYQKTNKTATKVTLITDGI
jgi:hypothetical protein